MKNPESKKKKALREYVEALVTAVLLAFVIRSFIVEPFKIPSKSMVPTLLVGDHIFVSKFTYGLRVPWTKKWIFKLGDPKRGDVIVFIYPGDESLDFIKRVIGVPGDHIVVHEGHFFVNGKELPEEEIMIKGVNPLDPRQLEVASTDSGDLPAYLKTVPFFKGYESFKIEMEQLDDKKFFIQRSRFMPATEETDLVVPPGNFFVMGDNRDQSADSRIWGLVPRENLKGKALFIWLSLDNDRGGIRIKRFGKKII